MNSYKLHGILNGINMDAFNPETDSKIFKNYGPNNPQDKLVNKTELLKLCALRRCKHACHRHRYPLC